MKKRLILMAILTAGLLSAFEAPPRQAGKASPVVYQLPEIREMNSGTIRFSFKWTEPDLQSFVTMLQLDGADGMLRLYIYPHRHQGFLALRTFKDKSPHLALSAHRLLIDQWRKKTETWHRIILTWSPTEGRLYLDGRPVAIDPQFGRKPMRFSQVTWGRPTIYYAPNQPGEPTNRSYELGKLEILPEAMTPEAVIADWRSVNSGHRDTDEF